MKFLNKIKVGGRIYELYGISGKVVSTGKTTTTQTYLSESQYSSESGSYVIPIYHTSSTIHDQIFLIDKYGEEHAVKLLDWDISVRETHDISIYWLKNKKYGKYIAVFNHSINRNLYDNNIIFKLNKPRYRRWVLLLAFFIICYIAKQYYGYYYYEKLLYTNDSWENITQRVLPDYSYALWIFGSTIAAVILSVIIYKIVVSSIARKGMKHFKNMIENTRVD